MTVDGNWWQLLARGGCQWQSAVVDGSNERLARLMEKEMIYAKKEQRNRKS